MSWSKDQRPTHARALSTSSASQSPAHPAKSVMDERWEQRRAAVNARWAEMTQSVVIERADDSGVQATDTSARPDTSEAPSAELLLADMRQLELKDESHNRIAQHPLTPHGRGPLWLRDTQRALLIVAALSCSTLLALLYFGGFLG
jgi:hypothetical protein